HAQLAAEQVEELGFGGRLAFGRCVAGCMIRDAPFGTGAFGGRAVSRRSAAWAALWSARRLGQASGRRREAQAPFDGLRSFVLGLRRARGRLPYCLIGGVC
ncbi:MAG: hypothetical protein JXR37_28980, partial [Kiritimatiellae bacterium]|nr:hypothetical protein [Kiritimatiellia bacterium]